jgi:lysophospholipase L1-like esterase
MKSIPRQRVKNYLAALVLITGLTAPPELFAQASTVESKAPTHEMLPGKGPAQRGDWFDQVWSERRTAFQATKAADRGAVVFLGDSITQGWGEVGRHFPKYHCANRGISGDTTRGILYRLQEDVLDLKPAAVVLLIGTNDIEIGADPAEVADNLKVILARLRAAEAKLPVIVCKVMPSSETKRRPPAKIQKLNALVDEIVKSDPLFIRCDTFSIYADENGNAKPDEFPDLLHLNAAGYAKWVAALNPILSPLPLPAPHAPAAPLK